MFFCESLFFEDFQEFQRLVHKPLDFFDKLIQKIDDPRLFVWICINSAFTEELPGNLHEFGLIFLLTKNNRNCAVKMPFCHLEVYFFLEFAHKISFNLSKDFNNFEYSFFWFLEFNVSELWIVKSFNKLVPFTQIVPKIVILNEKCFQWLWGMRQASFSF